MNLKGQWSTLKRWQQYKLIHYACIKDWRAYWSYKLLFLQMNIKEED